MEQNDEIYQISSGRFSVSAFDNLQEKYISPFIDFQDYWPK